MEKSMKVKIGIGAAVAVVAVLLVLSGMDKGQKKADVYKRQVQCGSQAGGGDRCPVQGPDPGEF